MTRERGPARPNWVIASQLCVLLLGGALVGCEREKSARGFRLPDGNISQGQVAFETFGCHSCHRIKDIEFDRAVEPGPVDVVLGGETSRVRTYGELVTSIINPSHRISGAYDTTRSTPSGGSRMSNYNSVLTVQELIDLVAFLQAQYEIVPPAYEYHSYTYGP